MNIEGLTRYIEKASIPFNMIKKADQQTLQESLSKVHILHELRESIGSGSAQGYWVPISFYNKINGNRRNYNKKLWENVITKQRDNFIGSPMLTDHPEGDSDGSPQNICGVWLDAKLGPEEPSGIGLVYGLLVPSGHLGADLQDHLKNGLRIGTSSSGFGKLLPDGVTVDPDTFQIERLADWVLNPSQGTFFAYDESDDNIEDKSFRESVSDDAVSVSMTDNKQENMKENVVKDSTSTLTRLEEKKFRRDMESFLESAIKIEDPQARLQEFKDIRSWLDNGACPDLKEQVEAKIQEAEEYIHTALQEKAEYQNELEISSPKDLKEKLTSLAEDTKILKEESIGWKDVSTKLQEKLNEAKAELETRPTAAYADWLKEKNATLTQALNERSDKMKEVVSELLEAYENVKAENEKLRSTNDSLREKLIAVTERVSGLTESSKNGTQMNEALENSTYKVSVALKEANDKIAKMSKIMESQRKQIEEYAEKEAKAAKLAEKRKVENSKLNSSLNAAQKKTLSLVQEKRKEAEVKGESTVTAYYNKLYESYGNSVKPFENRIKACKTLPEAKQYFFKNVLQNMTESKEITAMQLPETLEATPDKRIQKLGESNFQKTSMFDRMPKGWI